MTTDRPACVLELEQVDALNWAAHRIVLYGNLLARELDDQWKEGDLVVEALTELTTNMITDATAAKAIMAAGCQTAKQETAETV